jgi:hypothetical protein
MLLNVADPSGGSVIRDRLDYGDLPLRDQLSIETGKGMKFYALTYAKDLSSLTGADLLQPAVLDFYPRIGDQFMLEVESFSWNLWEEPLYQFRLKKSYRIIADYFDTIP